MFPVNSLPVILGDDSFTGWFSNDYKSENERVNSYKEVINLAYSSGIKTFICCWHNSLNKILKDFKEHHSDIVCIANPQWNNYYYFNNHSLWTEYYRQKCVATINSRIEKVSSHWLKNINVNDYFSEKDLNSIYLKEKDLEKCFSELSFCDYFTFGNLWYDFFYYTNKIDIVMKELSIIKYFNKKPLGIISGGELPLSILSKLNINNVLIWFNRYYSFPNIRETKKAIKNTKCNLIAYRIFENNENLNIKESLSFISAHSKIKGFVVGIDNLNQAKETFAKINTL